MATQTAVTPSKANTSVGGHGTDAVRAGEAVDADVVVEFPHVVAGREQQLNSDTKVSRAASCRYRDISDANSATH